MSVTCKAAAVAPSSALPRKRVATGPVGFFLDLSWFAASFPPAGFAANEWAASESALPATLINYSSYRAITAEKLHY